MAVRRRRRARVHRHQPPERRAATPPFDAGHRDRLRPFGFGRMALDEAAKTLRVDVAGGAPAIRILRGDSLSLIINGIEVSGGQ